MVELTTHNLYSHKLNDRERIIQNFKTVVQSQVELHSCKVEELDVSIRPLLQHLRTMHNMSTLTDTGRIIQV